MLIDSTDIEEATMNLNDALSFITNFEGEQNDHVSADDISTLHWIASMALLHADYLFTRTTTSKDEAEKHALSIQEQFLAAYPFPRWSEAAEKMRFLATFEEDLRGMK